MADFADPLQQEISAAKEQAATAGMRHDAVLAAADRFAVLIRTLDDARRKASEEARAFIGECIQAGIDPREFYGRPFTGTIVRAITKDFVDDKRYSALFPHRGRRPQTKPKG